MPPSLPLLVVCLLLLCEPHLARKPRSCAYCDPYAPPDHKETVISPYTFGGKHYNVSHTRVLGIVLIFDTKGIDHLTILMDAYVEMCEEGFDVNVALLTSDMSDWKETTFVKTFSTRYHCRRINSPIGLQTNSFNKSLGINLAGKTREILRDNVEKYDAFVYQEHDMLVKASHIKHYITETNKLNSSYASTGSGKITGSRYMLGFLRYIKKKWGSAVLEAPKLQPTCLLIQSSHSNKGGSHISSVAPYIVMSGNTHQAMFVMTRDQLKMLDKRCNFFEQDQYKTKREYFSSFSFFSDVDTGIKRTLELPSAQTAYCHITKIVPAETSPSFNVEHLDQHPMSTFQSVQDFYWSKLFKKNLKQIEALDCWKKPLESYREHLAGIVRAEEEEKIRLGYKHDTFYSCCKSSDLHVGPSLTNSDRNQPTHQSASALVIILLTNFALDSRRITDQLSQYVQLCESGVGVDIVLLSSTSRTTSEWQETHFLKSFAIKYHCQRVNAPIGLQTVSYTNADVCLAAKSRDILKSNVDKYDLFIYQDDDVIVTPEHITSYIEEANELERLSIRSSPTYRIGFLQVHRPRLSASSPMSPSLLPPPYIVDEPRLRPICRGSSNAQGRSPYVEVGGNSQQGLFILTKEQLKQLEILCGFFGRANMVEKREYFSSYSLFERPHLQALRAHDLPVARHAYCAGQKVIPADKLLQFTVERVNSQQTLPQTQIQSPNSTFTFNEFIEKKLFLKRKKSFLNLDKLGCWQDILRNKTNDDRVAPNK